MFNLKLTPNPEIVGSKSVSGPSAGKGNKTGPTEPGYRQLAKIIRERISSGIYKPGDRLPTEHIIGKEVGLSLMTARRAVGLLVEEGLIERVHGLGTFVRGLGRRSSNINLDRLAAALSPEAGTEIEIVLAKTTLTDEKTARGLGLQAGQKAIFIKRVLKNAAGPFMTHYGYLRRDPRSPVIETEMDLTSLSIFLTDTYESSIKKAWLAASPVNIPPADADLLALEHGAAVFKVEYQFFSFDDRPVNYGYFHILPEYISIETKIGLWAESNG